MSWNVHGNGDLAGLIEHLQRGAFTDGKPIADFVLLLQEVMRTGAEVPRRIPADSPVPRRIGAGARDVRDLARAFGLALLYAPSMRNGSIRRAEDDADDRGNAILSTLRYEDPTIIELPFERQRRVAVAATLAGRDTNGGARQLRVANVHFDTSVALTRGGPLSARRRQARALIEALDIPTLRSTIRLTPDTAYETRRDDTVSDIVVGGDFNTWLGEGEPALVGGAPTTIRC